MSLISNNYNKRILTLNVRFNNNKSKISNEPIHSHTLPHSRKSKKKPTQSHTIIKWPYNIIRNNLNKPNNTNKTQNITKTNKTLDIKIQHTNKIIQNTKHLKSKTKNSHPHKTKLIKNTFKPKKPHTTEKELQNIKLIKYKNNIIHTRKIKTITTSHIKINKNKNKTYYKKKTQNLITKYNQARPTGLARKIIITKENHNKRNIKKNKTHTYQTLRKLHKPHKHTRNVYNTHTQQNKKINIKQYVDIKYLKTQFKIHTKKTQEHNNTQLQNKNKPIINSKKTKKQKHLTKNNNNTNTTNISNILHNHSIKLLILLGGDIETNPGPMPNILKTHPPSHRSRNKIYFIPCTIKLHP